VIAYKWLRPDGTSVFTGFRWPLPDGGPGTWVDSERTVPCASGIHACRASDLPYWVGRALYEIELADPVIEEPMKVIAPRGRLLRRIDAWDDALRDAYTRMCADRGHELARGAGLDPGWDAAIEPSVREGPALLGFMAARLAEEISGGEAYYAERARQTAWLVDRLAL
jgi:hypothetical protein